MFKDKTLVVDARMLDSAGIGTYLKQLIPFLSDAFLLTLLVRDFQPKWKSIDQVECDVPIYSVKEQWKLPFQIPPCDLFFSPHYNIPLLPIRAKKRCVTIHDVFHLAHLSSLKLSEKLYAKAVISQAVRRSDLIFTDSKFSYEEILRYSDADPKKIHIIPLACSSNMQSSIDFEKIQEKYDIPDTYFLFVGNVKPHKNLKGILAAYQRSDDLPPLMVVGKKEGLLNQDDLQDLFSEHPELHQKVHFLGKIPDHDLLPLFQNALSLLFPSFYEGFGLPPLEAMRLGCPVIASNCASIPEVCGDAVLYIDPYRPESIFDAMLQMVKNPSIRQKYKQLGNERVKEFSWEKSAEMTIQAIEKIL